jgi:hypothetical protein
MNTRTLGKANERLVLARQLARCRRARSFVVVRLMRNGADHPQRRPASSSLGQSQRGGDQVLPPANSSLHAASADARTTIDSGSSRETQIASDSASLAELSSVRCSSAACRPLRASGLALPTRRWHSEHRLHVHPVGHVRWYRRGQAGHGLDDVELRRAGTVALLRNHHPNVH